MKSNDDLSASPSRSLPSCPRASLPWHAAQPGAVGDRGSAALDGWVVPPHTAAGQRGDRGSVRRTETMTQPLVELVEQFCIYHP
jgi:hypothetical protein